MIRITVGLGKNKNIVKACSILNKKTNLDINIFKKDEELISAIYDDNIDGVVRGSLPASGVIKNLKNKIIAYKQYYLQNKAF